MYKPMMLKYICRTENYIIYFQNQDDASKYFHTTVQQLNKNLHYKKGVRYFRFKKDEPKVAIEDTLIRVWKKPYGVKFNTYYDLHGQLTDTDENLELQLERDEDNE